MNGLLVCIGAAGLAAMVAGQPSGPAAWVREELKWLYRASFDRGHRTVDHLLGCPVCLGFWVGLVAGLVAGFGIGSVLVGGGASWLNLAFAIRGVPADATRGARSAPAKDPRGCDGGGGGGGAQAG